jgi:hypothetical protein
MRKFDRSAYTKGQFIYGGLFPSDPVPGAKPAHAPVQSIEPRPPEPRWGEFDQQIEQVRNGSRKSQLR